MTATKASLNMYLTLNLPIRKPSATPLNHILSPRVAKVLRHKLPRARPMHGECRDSARTYAGLWEFTHSANRAAIGGCCAKGSWAPHLCPEACHRRAEQSERAGLEFR